MFRSTKWFLIGVGMIAVSYTIYQTFDRLKFMYWDIVDAAERLSNEYSEGES